VSIAVPTSGPVTPAFFSPAPIDRATKPQIHVVVDTEEEFNWSKPFSRAEVGVTAIDDVDRLQAVLAPYTIKPTYVIDYPVASTAASAERLAV
jgi:hypothetical protein